MARNLFLRAVFAFNLNVQPTDGAWVNSQILEKTRRLNMSADMKKFIEVAAKKWFTLAWKDKIAGSFTNSSSFSGDKLNTLIGLVINAMQHGMIYVGRGMLPSANRPEDFQQIAGPSPEALNRLGSFTGPMSASFQVAPPAAPVPGDIQTAELYGKRGAEITERWVKAKLI